MMIKLSIGRSLRADLKHKYNLINWYLPTSWISRILNIGILYRNLSIIDVNFILNYLILKYNRWFTLDNDIKYRPIHKPIEYKIYKSTI